MQPLLDSAGVTVLCAALAASPELATAPTPAARRLLTRVWALARQLVSHPSAATATAAGRVRTCFLALIHFLPRSELRTWFATMLTQPLASFFAAPKGAQLSPFGAFVAHALGAVPTLGLINAGAFRALMAALGRERDLARARVLDATLARLIGAAAVESAGASLVQAADAAFFDRCWAAQDAVSIAALEHLSLVSPMHRSRLVAKLSALA